MLMVSVKNRPHNYLLRPNVLVQNFKVLLFIRNNYLINLLLKYYYVIHVHSVLHNPINFGLAKLPYPNLLLFKIQLKWLKGNQNQEPNLFSVTSRLNFATKILPNPSISLSFNEQRLLIDDSIVFFYFLYNKIY